MLVVTELLQIVVVYMFILLVRLVVLMTHMLITDAIYVEVIHQRQLVAVVDVVKVLV